MTAEPDAADPEGVALARAQSLLQLRRPEEAERLATGVISRDPANETAWLVVTRARLARDDHRGAWAAAQRCIALAPDDVDGYVLGAIASSYGGAWRRAVRLARDAVARDPTSWWTQATLGQVQSGATERTGRRPGARDRREAMAAADRARQLAPMLAEAHYAYGSTARACGSRDEADRAYREALRLDPQHVGAQHGLALLQVRSRFRPHDLGRAAKGFQDAVRTDPGARRSRESLERVLLTALSVTAYTVVLVTWLVRSTSESGAVAARLVPLIGLVVPAVFIARFWASLSPPLRDHLRYLVTRSPLRASCAAIAAAVVCLLAAGLAPQGARVALAAMALLLALGGRFGLAYQGRRRVDGSRPSISDGFLWALVVVLGGLGLLLLAASSADGNVGAGLAVALVFLAPAAWPAAVLARRRRHRSTAVR